LIKYYQGKSMLKKRNIHIVCEKFNTNIAVI